MEIQEMYLTINKYSRPNQRLQKVTHIVVHWVGNPGSTAVNNRNYFENLKNGANKTYASSHYIIGLKGEVICCVPENEIAYHANHANSYSIGIENCHPDATGKFTEDTYNALVTLCAQLCKKYNLNPTTSLIRHYDVTKKVCPKYFVEHPDAWERFKKDVIVRLAEDTPNTIKINLFGQIVEVETIVKDNANYVKLRSLAPEGSPIEISYDAEHKLPCMSLKNQNS